jgi:hypothetical protein
VSEKESSTPTSKQKSKLNKMKLKKIGHVSEWNVLVGWFPYCSWRISPVFLS